MNKRIIIYAITLLTVLTASAQTQYDRDLEGLNVSDGRWNLNVRGGYAIGGTMPMGMPEEMRGLNGYTPKLNYRLGVDVERRFNDRYGLQAGLYLERHGFKGDVNMRQYDLILRQGGERIEGPFTGNVVMNIVQTGITIPIQGTWWFAEKGKLKFGPYVQFLTDRKFEGYAYGNKVYDSNGNWTGSFDAYIRRGDSRGEKLEIGDIYTDDNGLVVDKSGTFDGQEFNDYLRWFQWGLTVGADYYIAEHWGAFADLSYGVNSAFTNAEGNPVDMKLHPLYFTLGVTYRFGK